MIFILCYLCPPLAILLCGRPFAAFFSVFFCILGWFPGVRMALIIADQHYRDKRNMQLVGAINGVSRSFQQPPMMMMPPPTYYLPPEPPPPALPAGGERMSFKRKRKQPKK